MTSTETESWAPAIQRQLAERPIPPTAQYAVIHQPPAGEVILVDVAATKTGAHGIQEAHAATHVGQTHVVALEELLGGSESPQDENHLDLDRVAAEVTNAVADIIEDAVPGTFIDERFDEPEPNADTGQLFDTPRAHVDVDDADPNVIRLAFSGSIELERSNPDDVRVFNAFREGRTFPLSIEVFAAGVKLTHRRDTEGNVDSVVATKSLRVDSLTSTDEL